MPSQRVLLLGFVAASGLVLGSCAGNTSTPADNLRLYAESISRMHQLAQGMNQYMVDNDDVLPLSQTWMDALAPYVRNEALYSSPALESRAPAYGYAFNSAIAGHGYAEFSAATTISIFDSTVIARNATAPISTLPHRPRYGVSNTIAYLDGHVQDETINVSPAELAKIAETRLKQLSVGFLIYASDHDDNLSPGPKWIEELTPYIQAETTFHSPVFTDPGKYGFAYDGDAAGKNLSTLDFPAQISLDFDSTILTRSAVSTTITLPVPARYQGGNFIGYIDGHVKQVN